MANPNPTLWGDSTNWIDSYNSKGLNTQLATTLKCEKPKVNNFGTISEGNNWNGSLMSAVENGVIPRNQPLDRTICPCGQDPNVSPWGQVALFNQNHDFSSTPSSIITTDNNVNWFFADWGYARTQENNRHIYAEEYEWYSHIGLKYDQWSPLSPSPSDSYNNNYPLMPYTYYSIKSLLLSLEVRCVAANAANTYSAFWVTLDNWKQSYNSYHICGMRFFVRNCTAINTNTLQLTYNNDRSQIDQLTSGQLAVIQTFNIMNNGALRDTEFLTLNMPEQNNDRCAYVFNETATINNMDSLHIMGVLPCWQYFAGQTVKSYGGNDRHYFYSIPYSVDNYEKCMQIAALFGCYFTPTSKYTFNYNMQDNDLYLSVIDDNGVAHGQYTHGAENANNSLYAKSSIRDIDYDPTAPPTPVDPNTYSDTTNWNNVDFRQAFTKRYLLTGAQVAQLSTELWAAQSSKPADIDYNNFAIDEYLTNNPIDTIVSLKYFPCTFADTAPAVVHLGKYTTSIAATALGTSVRIIDFAPIECFPHFNDFRDYEPYTELAMYIPFCGTVKIPTAECMGNYVSVKLAIDTNTGAATGYVIVSKTGTGGICVATCQGMAAIDIPVSGLQSANLANAVFNATANWTQTQVNNISANSGLFKHMGGAMGAIARGMTNSVNLSDVKGGILGGPIGAAGTLVNSLNPISALQKGMNIDIDNAKADYELSHIQVPTRLVGSASPVLGCVIELDCRMIIYRPVTDENALSNYADTVGFATVQGGTVGQFEGFTVGTIDVSGINATAKEKQAIAAAFANGVYL